MSVFITCHPDGHIDVIARLEMPDGSAYGDARFELAPGQGLDGYSYEELRAHGSGYLEDKATGAAVSASRRASTF